MGHNDVEREQRMHEAILLMGGRHLQRGQGDRVRVMLVKWRRVL